MPKPNSKPEDFEYDLLRAVEDIATSLRRLSGREDSPAGAPGPIEAIAMLLGASSGSMGSWGNVLSELDGIRRAIRETKGLYDE